MNKSKILVFVLILIFLGVIVYSNQKGLFVSLKNAYNDTNITQMQNMLKFNPMNDISYLEFTYEEDTFSLKKAQTGKDNYAFEYRAGDQSTMRVYTFMRNDPNLYAGGEIDGAKIIAFVLWRGSGANIIEPILFVFGNNDDVWQQITYAKLPPDGGRTTIDKFYIQDNSIILDVKTSGPDKNYHETYVPKHYIYKLNNNELEIESEKADLIRLDTPLPNQTISSPLTIKGYARGNWFFEASFPVILTDWDGLIIAQGIAQAKDNWMTLDFVPFEARLDFTIDKQVYSNKGTLILRKDNPTGLSEFDDALEIPIIFSNIK